MTMLGVSTSGTESSIALWRDGSVVGEDAFPGSRSCVEELLPRTERLLEEHDVEMQQIERYAVDIGPGGLTGIKIGLVAVKTLAQVFDRPIVPVSALHAMCHAAPPEWQLILPAVKCTRNDFYAALYKREGVITVCIEPDALYKTESLATLLEKTADDEFRAIGNAAERVGEAVAAAGGRAKPADMDDTAQPTARAVCEIAADRDGLPWTDVQPDYLCLTNAERNFGIRA